MTTTAETPVAESGVATSSSDSWVDRLAKSKREILIASGIASVVVLGGLVWSHFNEQAEADAAARLYEARLILSQELKALDPSLKVETPPPAEGEEAPKEEVDSAQPFRVADMEGDKRFKELAPAEAFAKGVPALTGVYEDYPSTKAGFDAAFELGTLHLEHGQTDDAVTWFERARNSASTRFDKAAALYNLAYAYEAKEDYKKALTLFADGAKSSKTSFKPEFMFGEARLLLKGPETEVPRAREIYEKIVKDYAGSAWERKAKGLLGGLKRFE
jgi:tetratricopeptide (TPR) repeat protein